MHVRDLATVNATLNAISAVLLVIGYVLIRQRRIAQHRAAMLTAFATSTAFLICYLVYHAQVGSVPFQKHGPIRALYFTILAATVPVLAIITLNRALKARFDKHRKIARWTFPIWLYVSVTGVVVYVMLYKL
jgi:uncharacterized membrane protein YozB (DUF420 family)